MRGKVHKSLKKHAASGFSLIEVLVSILVVAFGLLGLAKMQATAMTNVQSANSRTLVATHTGSLLAGMHANRAYWAELDSALNIKVTRSTTDPEKAVIAATPALAEVPSNKCQGDNTDTAPACTPAQFATYEIQTWVDSMNRVLPEFEAEVACTQKVVATETEPAQSPGCTVTVSWRERYATATQTMAADSKATGGKRTYILYVQP